jgi:hypothetical protein
MRTLNGWPLFLLALFFGAALLPTAVMIGLELNGAHWWGPRSSVVVGFGCLALVEYALLEGLSTTATNFGYVFKSTEREERVEVFIYIATYLTVANFLPILIFFCVVDILFPWEDSIFSLQGLTTVAALTVMASLLSVMLVWIHFRAGYVQERDDVRNGVPPQLDISSLRKIRDARRKP